ncbi:MAG: hypothetical protein WEA59_06005 [Ferruginibacter sp.]
MYYRKYLMTLFTFISVAIHAQETDITGLWKGTLYNDTTQIDYQYEIGISKEKGKYVGYSHTWFILDDKQYYGVKKVKINIANDGKIIVEDDGLISNNYPVPPSKNVRQLNILSLDATGPAMILTGPFSTNRTKQYHSLTGRITLQKKIDFWQSALIPHLEELGRASKLSFMKINKEEKNSLAAKTNVEDVYNNDRHKHQQEKASNGIEMSKKETAVKALAEKDVDIKKPDAESAVVVSNNSKNLEENKKKVNSTLQQEVGNKQTVATTSIAPAALVNERQTIIQQTVSFSSDSLLLSLYDNGEVDGDTVSVLLNGTIILEKQGLSTVAIKKNIYIPSHTDRMELVMYAETLGSIAPNTGLLVIKDGKNLYEVRFSGDLQKNASIVFNRKKE